MSVVRSIDELGPRTLIYESGADIVLAGSPTVMFAISGVDERTEMDSWKARCMMAEDRCILLESEDSTSMTIRKGGVLRTIQLADEDEVAAILENPDGCCIDLTSLSFRVFAPVVRAALANAPK